ncbi:MAG: VanZ family protein [Propionicimonas sp.]|nr:VanZ family protein [Propionicimonas sp.]
MLRQFGPSTWLAILLGSMLAVAAFLPVVASRYRAAGRLRPSDLVTLLAVAIYAVALWTYTLVPLPQGDFRCASANLEPLAFLDAIRAEGGRLVRNHAFLQAAFNVILFMPLGYFLRVVARRGVVVATAAGLVVTVAIESTQYTGLWGLFPCAYRVFDVDDLLLNTLGAFLGSLAAVPVVAVLDRARPEPPVTEVSLGRRLTGMLADVMVTGFLGIGAIVGWRAAALYVLGIPLEDLPAGVEPALGLAVPMAVEAWWVLRHSRTVGEAIVQLEAVARQGRELVSRILKLLFGVGGYLVVSAVLADTLVPLLYAFVTVVVAWRSPGRRGLSHLVSGMELRIERLAPVALDREVF